MHAKIRMRAAGHGLVEDAGTLLILPYRAEDISLIHSALPEGVDTMISVCALCSLPLSETLCTLVQETLKPDGQLIFYEHVLSARPDVAWWQRFWTPVWKRHFDGCRLDRPTHEIIRNMKGANGSMWSAGESHGDEEEESLFWHHSGRYVKA